MERLTEDDGVFPGELVREIASDQNTKPCAQLEDRNQPTFLPGVRDGVTHALIEGVHPEVP